MYSLLATGLCESFGVFVTACLPVGKFADTEFFRITGIDCIALDGADDRTDDADRPRLGSASQVGYNNKKKKKKEEGNGDRMNE